MYLLFFWWNAAWDCRISHKIYLGWIDGSSRHRVADGGRSDNWKFYQTSPATIATKAQRQKVTQRKYFVLLSDFVPSWQILKLQTRKPDSVSKLSFIWDADYSAPLSAYPSTSGEQPSNVDIHGISSCKVYPCYRLPGISVGSYPTFSPSSCHRRDSYFLWHCLYKDIILIPALHRCTALRCPDFPGQ